jgi:hypothetical protein
MSNAQHNMLLTANAIASAAFGVSFLVAPGQSQNLFGLSYDVSSLWISRFFGAAIVGYAALSLFARQVNEPDARRALDGGFLISWVGTLGIALWSQYLQVMNSLGWVVVATAALFSVAYFYFLAGEDRFQEAFEDTPRPS